MKIKTAPVTVIIPFYNGSKYIDNTIQSVLQQTLRAEEIIIVDDGSSDTESRYLDAFTKDCTVIRQKNMGPSVARNVGIKLAKNEWVAFLDHDDWWETDKLFEQFAFINDNPQCHAVHTAVKSINDSNLSAPIIYRKKALSIADFLNNEPCPAYNSSVIIRRDSLIASGLFNPFLWMSQDQELYLRIAKLYGIQYIDKPLTIRRNHDNNLSANRIAVWKEACAIFSFYRGLFDNNKQFRKLLADIHADYALVSIYHREFYDCKKILVEALNQGLLIRTISNIFSKYFNKN